MEGEIELRVATPEDYDFLYGLHCATMRDYIEATWGWDEAWQQNHFKQHFQPEANQIILLNGHKIGRVEMDCNEDRDHIGNIQILPAHQNNRVGSRVILNIIRQAQLKERPVTLQVLKVNPARQLYERLGFVVEGEDEA
ncbi:MAG TPA: GNAT family N-acetyltransferase, partial [Trichocoleus sp.]